MVANREVAILVRSRGARAAADVALKPRGALRSGGDVHLHADELGDRAVREHHRRDGEQVPELGPVLAVVEEAHGDALARAHGVADALDVVHVRLLALQEPAVLVQDLGGVVAGHLQEPVAGVDDGAVGQGGVAHREGVP